MLLNLKSSKTLNLSFYFKLTKYKNKILHIYIKKFLRDLKYFEKVFLWFIEDLIIFLDANKYQKKWNYEKIIVSSILNLMFSKKDEINFKSKFKLITSWDMEWE